jgi:hypothetical protein
MSQFLAGRELSSTEQKEQVTQSAEAKNPNTTETEKKDDDGEVEEAVEEAEPRYQPPKKKDPDNGRRRSGSSGPLLTLEQVKGAAQLEAGLHLASAVSLHR